MTKVGMLFEKDAQEREAKSEAKGLAKGRAEGEAERKKLADEIARLRAQLETMGIKPA